ncbi:MAG: hypothetical protein AAFY11_09095 [Cyanobacteria bacterium J06641_5]
MLEISPRDRFGSAREILQALSPNAPLPPLESTEALEHAANSAHGDESTADPTNPTNPNQPDFEPTQAFSATDTDTVAGITETHAPATNAIAADRDEGPVAGHEDAPAPLRTRVLIVQDVQVLARSLARKLLRMEYGVVDVVTSLQVARDRAG